MPFRWWRLHITAHITFLWRRGGTPQDGFDTTTFSFFVRLVQSCGFPCGFLGVESKEFVTATADSINGGGTFADFLRLLMYMRLS